MQKEEFIRTHLFLVRMWNEELGDGESEMRGRLQDVLTGETSYFRDWEGLVGGMKRMLAMAGGDGQAEATISEPDQGESGTDEEG